MAIELSISSSDLKELDKKLNDLKNNTGKSAWAALVTIAFKIRNEAMMRLQGRDHVRTSRLKNSIFVKGKKQSEINAASGGGDKGQSNTYKDNTGKSYDSDLRSVSVSDFDLAIGSNVEYATAIEFGAAAHDINSPVNIRGVGWRYIKKHPGFKGDSFLYWGLKNVDIAKTAADLIRQDIEARPTGGRKKFK